MELSYSVKAVIRLDKKRADGTCPIYFSLRVGKSFTKIPSTKFIHPNDWDAKNKKPKTSGKDGKLLAQFLNDKISGFDTAMLKIQNLKKPVTILVAESYFKGTSNVNLFDFWEAQVSLSTDYSPNTVKSYKSVLTILKQFNKKLSFGDLSTTLIRQFDQFLATKRGNSINGRFVKHKCFRSILYKAVECGHIERNPYEGFEVKQTEGVRKSLTLEEVNLLARTVIPENMPNLQSVRDLFLFSCYTGLRYSDVINLRGENIKTDMDTPRLDFIVKKTQRPEVYPLNDEALDLINKYIRLVPDNDDRLVFPTIANPVINRGLKDVMKLVDIKKTISFHCGRHSFASNHLQSGTIDIHVMKLLGHRNIKETLIYAKPLSSDIINSVKRLSLLYKTKELV
ncbi:site-specific integrase [Mucilaginibacter sp. HC2]|uniref:site-specific integrase n=1 Tax=Mucilaginibacter inviolabilis TaxID=2714892 RepID=UPI001408EF56|nr:site-specific integrase [Mucilaginibacter inviolabilis]NHA07712.1 site-specific integrase [Mucilaginibacter inviolabilis]